MKILITGAGGFVGPYLCKQFSDWEVIPTDHTAGKGISVLDVLDFEGCNAFFEKQQPDAVVHLAAQSSVKKSWEDPVLTKKINVEGTRNILTAAKKHTPTAKILIISSSEVYGKPYQMPITEKTPLTPVSPYGESRVEQEKLAQEFKDGGMHIIILRSFSHTGPGQQPIFVCAEFAKAFAEMKAKKRDLILRVGDTSVKRDFSDVRDIVVAYRLAIEKARPGIYNICSGKAYSIEDVIEIFEVESLVIPRVETDPTKIRKNDIPLLLGSHKKFSKETGWEPTIPFSETLNDLYEDFSKKVSIKDKK